MKKTKFKLGFRLHWLSWLTLVLMLFCMTVIVVPGISVPSNKEEQANASSNGLAILGLGAPSSYNDVFSHGWPCEYMRRELSTDFRFLNRIDWTSSYAWPNGNRIYSFQLTALIVDLLFAVVIVALSTVAVEFWRRRRKGSRFSIFDLFAAAALVAVAISWYWGHANDHATESRGVQFLDSGISVTVVEEQLDAPDWLVRLVGGERQIQFCKHVTEIAISSLTSADPPNELDAQRIEDVFECASGFKRAEVVYVNWPILPQLRSLVSDLRNIQKVKVVCAPEFAIDINNQAFIGGFGYGGPALPTPSSGRCSFRYYEHVHKLINQKVASFEMLQRLDQVKHLKTIELDLGYISRSAWQKLPPLSKVRSLSFASYEIFIEDLAILKRFKNLEKVSFWISAKNRALEDFQRENPHLEISWNRSIDLTDLELSNRRFTIWQMQDNIQRGETWLPECSDDSLSGQLDLKDLNLTKQRLGMIEGDLVSIEDLEIGAFDSMETVNGLVKKCPQLVSLDLSLGNFTRDHLRQLELPAGLSLIVRQRDVTARDFIDLGKKMGP